MKRSDFIACERCGGELKIFEEASAQGLVCASCGWSVVTTHIPDIKVDETKYEVYCSGDYKNEVHIRAVSEVVGCNFLMARKTLEHGRSLVFIGQAEEVLRVRNTLASAGLVCVISPDFNWG